MIIFILISFITHMRSVWADVIVVSPIPDLPNPINNTTEDGITTSFAELIQEFIGWTIVFGVIAITYAGIKYVLSMGDSGKMKKATTLVIYALIGTLIAVSAYAIVSVIAKIELS